MLITTHTPANAVTDPNTALLDTFSPKHFEIAKANNGEVESSVYATSALQ